MFFRLRKSFYRFGEDVSITSFQCMCDVIKAVKSLIRDLDRSAGYVTAFLRSSMMLRIMGFSLSFPGYIFIPIGIWLASRSRPIPMIGSLRFSFEGLSVGNHLLYQSQSKSLYNQSMCGPYQADMSD